MTVAEPVIQFSAWFSWSERYAVPGADHAGLYLLAQFQTEPPMAVDPCCSELIYIGESCDRNIGNRFYEFHRSAFQAKNGHSAGWTYAGAFGDAGERLFVCALQHELTDKVVRSAYIRYVERKLIWDQVRVWGRLPRCNSK